MKPHDIKYGPCNILAQNIDAVYENVSEFIRHEKSGDHKEQTNRPSSDDLSSIDVHEIILFQKGVKNDDT